MLPFAFVDALNTPGSANAIKLSKLMLIPTHQTCCACSTRHTHDWYSLLCLSYNLLMLSWYFIVKWVHFDMILAVVRGSFGVTSRQQV